MSENFDQDLTFDWDKENIGKNWVKHKVTNKESEEVFLDPKVIISEDTKHSQTEKRWLILGKTKNDKYLALIFTKRDSKVRIISARVMNKKEKRLYEKEIATNSKI